MSVEWRTRDGAETLLLVDADARAISELAPPDEGTLRSYLAVTGTGETWTTWQAWRPVHGASQDPDDWGELVLSRADNGDVISIDPELFWASVHRWFRSRGTDYGP